MTKNTPKPIILEFTLDKLGQIHEALLALPMRRVEALVSRIRSAAAVAVKEAQRAAKKQEPKP